MIKRFAALFFVPPVISTVTLLCFRSAGRVDYLGIATAAGKEPLGFPKTVNSMTPRGADLGQLVIVNRTKRHFVSGNSPKIVFLDKILPDSSSTVVYVVPSMEASILY